jgi:hypothetical protein
MSSGNYGQIAVASIRSANSVYRNSKLTRVRRKEKVKLTLRQKIRNWLIRDDDCDDYDDQPIQTLESASLESEGMRFQLYKAAGGYVIETRHYDHKNDRNNNKMYVITDEKDLGEELGKIITMESLR